MDVATTRLFYPGTPPRFESGDALSRNEFERRYRGMHGVKAELIEGVVYLASPVFREHGQAHSDLSAWLTAYRAKHPEVEVSTEVSLRLGDKSEVQPDVFARLKEGGRSRYAPDRYLEGAPELVVEVAASSVARDLHIKLRAYRDAGVQEYIVWSVLEGVVDWFELVGGEYKSIQPDADNIMHSRVFPGLSLALDSLLEGDIDDVLAVQLGLPRPG